MWDVGSLFVGLSLLCLVLLLLLFFIHSSSHHHYYYWYYYYHFHHYCYFHCNFVYRTIIVCYCVSYSMLSSTYMVSALLGAQRDYEAGKNSIWTKLAACMRPFTVCMHAWKYITLVVFSLNLIFFSTFLLHHLATSSPWLDTFWHIFPAVVDFHCRLPRPDIVSLLIFNFWVLSFLISLFVSSHF